MIKTIADAKLQMIYNIHMQIMNCYLGILLQDIHDDLNNNNNKQRDASGEYSII